MTEVEALQAIAKAINIMSCVIAIWTGSFILAMYASSKR